MGLLYAEIRASKLIRQVLLRILHKVLATGSSTEWYWQGQGIMKKLLLLRDFSLA